MKTFIALFLFSVTCPAALSWSTETFLTTTTSLFVECPPKYEEFVKKFRFFQSKMMSDRKDIFLIYGNDLDREMQQCRILRAHGGALTFLKYDYIFTHMDLFQQLAQYQNQIFVMFSGKDDDKLKEYLKLLQNHSMMVILGFYNGASEDFLAHLFQEASINGLIHTIALVNSPKGVMFVRGRSVKSEDCITKTELVWREEAGDYHLKDLFRSQQPDFNGCNVNVSTYVIPPNSMVNNKTGRLDGFETKIIRVLGHVMNFKPIFLVSETNQKGRFTSEVKFGVLGEVYFGTSEIGYGVMWAGVDKYQEFDLTQAIENDCLTWITPHGRGHTTVTKYLTGYLTAAFRIKGWALLFISILSFLIITGSNQVLFSTKFHLSHFLLISFFDAISMLVQKPVPERRYRRANLKITLVCWLFYSQVICSIYTAILAGILVKPEVLPEIDSLSDIVASNLSLGGSLDVVDSIKMIESNDSIFRKIKERISVMEPTSKFISLMLNDRDNNMGICINKEAAFYIKDTTKGLRHYHVIKDCFISYPIVIVFKKRSPLVAFGRIILGRLIEAGLVNHWKTKLNAKTKKIYTFNSESLHRFIYIFYFYAAGISLSTLTFILEVFYFRFLKRRNTVLKN